MADRFATQIEIGGTFTLTDQNVEEFENFVSLLQSIAPNWGEKTYYLPDITDIDETINQNSFIYGCDDQKSGGEFEDIEIACQELGLSYDRRTDPKYEYDGESVYWRPGMENSHLCLCNADGNNYLLEENVTAAMKEELFNEELLDLSERISNFEKRIKTMLNGGVEPLEPFVLIDNRTVVTE